MVFSNDGLMLKDAIAAAFAQLRKGWSPGFHREAGCDKGPALREDPERRRHSVGTGARARRLFRDPDDLPQRIGS